MNRVTLLGRLGKDPEIRTTQSGDKIASFTLATTEQWKDKATGERKEKTEWHNVVIFGALAGTAERFLKKGNRVLLEGALKTRKWQDQSGADRYSTEVVLSGINSMLQIIDWPDDRGGESGSAQRETRGDPQPGSRSDMASDIPF